MWIISFRLPIKKLLKNKFFKNYKKEDFEDYDQNVMDELEDFVVEYSEITHLQTDSCGHSYELDGDMLTIDIGVRSCEPVYEDFEKEYSDNEDYLNNYCLDFEESK